MKLAAEISSCMPRVPARVLGLWSVMHGGVTPAFLDLSFLRQPVNDRADSRRRAYIRGAPAHRELQDLFLFPVSALVRFSLQRASYDLLRLPTTCHHVTWFLLVGTLTSRLYAATTSRALGGHVARALQ
jgi:hypothetical protein